MNQVRVFTFEYAPHKKKIKVDPRNSEMALVRIITDKLKVPAHEVIFGLLNEEGAFVSVKEFLNRLKSGKLKNQLVYELVIKTSNQATKRLPAKHKSSEKILNSDQQEDSGKNIQNSCKDHKTIQNSSIYGSYNPTSFTS
jgi:hypothetical protein